MDFQVGPTDAVEMARPGHDPGHGPGPGPGPVPVPGPGPQGTGQDVHQAAPLHTEALLQSPVIRVQDASGHTPAPPRHVAQLVSGSSSPVSVDSVPAEAHQVVSTSPERLQHRQRLFASLSPFHSRNSSSASMSQPEDDAGGATATGSGRRRHTTVVPSADNGTLSIPVDERDNLRTYVPTKVKETRHVYVEYDPISRRKVLNTYEILKDLGKGQHGKVKLARDMVSRRLVAIKIVDRKSKARLGKQLQRGSSQEDKIRKEIAIMKKCDHPHVVKLIEVLDDVTSRKIYLVLEYLEKGEIRWQHRDDHTHAVSPVLEFAQVQRIFRDVVSGLEYLHYQGIIHRDIKPANLLVSADDVVKISDFGVSFATSADYSNNEYDLCKTAGTPAFLAPELCRTDVISSQAADLKVDHKIDIWALGVTVFCLLFGRLPFTSDSEFKLFEVINSEQLQIPAKTALVHGDAVSDDEWDMAVDLLHRLLTKDPAKRIDIPEIKQHDFFLHGLSQSDVGKYFTANDVIKLYVSNEEVHHAVVGIGNKIKKRLAKAFKLGFAAQDDALVSFPNSPMDSSASSSSKPSVTKLTDSSARSLILSEALSPDMSSPELSSPGTPGPVVASPALASRAMASVVPDLYSERRGSADLIETRDFAEGSFKRSNNAALDHIMKINKGKRDSVENNSYLKESSSSRHSSVELHDPVDRKDQPAARSRLRSNASFASLDSLHEDAAVLDVSTYVPVGYSGTTKTNTLDSDDTGVKFNEVKYTLDDPDAASQAPRAYEPAVSSNSSFTNASEARRRGYSYSSVSSASSTGKSASTGVVSNGASTSSRKRATFFSFDNEDSSDDEGHHRPPSSSRQGVVPVQHFSSDEDDDDDKELTFEFGPKADPPFLKNRVMSHESNIPNAMRPASRDNTSSRLYAAGADSEYVIPASSSTVDLPEEFQYFIPELQPQAASSPVKPAAATPPHAHPVPSPLRMELTSSVETIKPHRVASPLAVNAPMSSKATVSSHLFSDKKQKDNFDSYKNHYSKDHNVIPFKHAHHLGNGNDTADTAVTSKSEKIKSKLHRHNSITIGLLQHDHDRKRP